jgi:hypothetical protein
VMIEAFAMWMLHLIVLRVVPLHLTSAYDAQDNTKITSLEGAVFPAGLTDLYLVSFGCCGYFFKSLDMMIEALDRSCVS